MKIITLDIETTGLVPKGIKYEDGYMDFPYILSMAWKINHGITYEYIINQEGRTVPPEATAINGITQEMCHASKFNTFSVLLQFMMDAYDSDFIVGHNIYFDTSIIKANVLRIIAGGITPMAMFEKISDILHKDKRIDTMRAGQKLTGGKWPKLTELYFALFAKEFNAHSAINDVEACWECFNELVDRGIIVLPTINGLELGKVWVDEEEV